MATADHTTTETPGSPAAADRVAHDEHDAFSEKPHIYAAGALAGGFVFAKILQALFGSDDD